MVYILPTSIHAPRSLLGNMAQLPPHTGYNFPNALHQDTNTFTDPTISDSSQPGKVILITRAGRGLGRSIALRYADSGVACIFLCSRRPSELDEVEEEIKKRNPNVKVRKLRLDISDEKQVAQVVSEVKEHGRLDVVINNASISSPWARMTATDLENYWELWHVHLKGVYLMQELFVPLLIETANNYRSHVDVVNVTSLGAYMPAHGASAYQTARFAHLRFTEFVCTKYEKEEENCIALHTGGVLSENNEEIQDSMFFSFTPLSVFSDRDYL